MIRFVCLQISDAASYARYREEMAPILSRFGGRFLLDVEGGEARIHPADFDVDRVLLIAFPDAESSDAFFADPDYARVRETWFTPAVPKTYATRL